MLVSFSSSGNVDPDGFISGVTWDFKTSDAVLVDSYWENATYLYHRAGSYRVKLIVTDNCGDQDTVLDTIMVSA